MVIGKVIPSYVLFSVKYNPCECELIRPTNNLFPVKYNYYYSCQLNILVVSIQMAILIVERVQRWGLVVMWQSWIEVEHYSALVKNELTVLIKALGLLPHCVQMSALFI